MAQRQAGPERCRRKFLRYFPGGFCDETYIDWERGYKWEAHERWNAALAEPEYRRLLRAKAYDEIAKHAVAIESRTNLLFSFEKMALRDAVRMDDGARRFAEGLFDFVYGKKNDEARFNAWRDTVADLPRRQTRVLTWPVLTVFGFIARPDREIFLKPNVTRLAAKKYGHELLYSSKPDWEVYSGVLAFAERVRRDVRDLKPRDMMDLQSFLWVQGSDEYP